MAEREEKLAGPFSLPYFAAVFSWIGVGDADRREAFVSEIYRIAATTPGFLGAERARQSGPDEVFGITIFFWATREALDIWQAAVEQYVGRSFRDADQSGMYEDWILRIAEVQEAMRMPKVGPA